MHNFRGDDFPGLFFYMGKYAQIAAKDTSPALAQGELDEHVRKHMLEAIAQHSSELGLKESRKMALRLHNEWRGYRPVTPLEISFGLSQLSAQVESEMREQMFYALPAGDTAILASKFPLGERIPVAFPLASEDLRESMWCIAFERGTASVFHAMRAVEQGLWAFCHHLGMSHVIEDSRRGTVLVIEHSQWQKILDQLKEMLTRR